MRGWSLLVVANAAGCNLVFEAVAENRSPCLADRAGLVLCLDFADAIDDGLASDLSQTGADGVVGPSISTVQRDIDNQAVHFDAATSIEVPFAPELDTFSALTFEITIKLDGPPSARPRCCSSTASRT